MPRLATVEIHREELKFSAGHFLIHDGALRENMHGHDYQISVKFHTLVMTNGMAFDVREYKERLKKLCLFLDYKFILPSQSEFLRLEEQADRWIGYFSHESLPFLKRDSVVLDICNVTLEELSYWITNQLTKNQDEIRANHIQGIEVTVYNGRGESGSYSMQVAALMKQTEIA